MRYFSSDFFGQKKSCYSRNWGKLEYFFKNPDLLCENGIFEAADAIF